MLQRELNRAIQPIKSQMYLDLSSISYARLTVAKKPEDTLKNVNLTLQLFI